MYIRRPQPTLLYTANLKTVDLPWYTTTFFAVLDCFRDRIPFRCVCVFLIKMLFMQLDVLFKYFSHYRCRPRHLHSITSEWSLSCNLGENYWPVFVHISWALITVQRWSSGNFLPHAKHFRCRMCKSACRTFYKIIIFFYGYVNAVKLTYFFSCFAGNFPAPFMALRCGPARYLIHLCRWWVFHSMPQAALGLCRNCVGIALF